MALRSKVDEARLVGVQRKAEPGKPVPQHFHDFLGAVVGLEGHHEVFGEPQQRLTQITSGPKTLLNAACYPGTDRLALRGSSFLQSIRYKTCNPEMKATTAERR